MVRGPTRRHRRSLVAMGLNPHRKMQRNAADYAMVIGGIVACVVLVAWALFG